MAIKGTVRYTNSEYAPGVSGYGVDGAPGKDGSDGSSVFVCIYDINSRDGLESFNDAILHSYDMTGGGTDKIGRDYIDNDNFLFPDGTIWRVDDISGLKNAIAVGRISDIESLKEFITHVASIGGNKDIGFTVSDTQMILDYANYKGFVIDTTGNAGAYVSDNGVATPLSIISGSAGSDNITRFLSMTNIFAGQTSTKFDIYYDNDNSAWVIDSDKPVLLNCDLKVDYKGEATIDGDEYSAPMLTSDSITDFYGKCKGIHIKVGNVTHPVTETEIDLGKVDNFITPKKRISNAGISYPDKIEYDANALLLPSSKTVYVRMGIRNGDRYAFQRLTQNSLDTFTIKLLYDNVVMEEVEMYRKIDDNVEITESSNSDICKFNTNGLLEINVEELTKDVDINSGYTLAIVWHYKVPNLDSRVDITATIPFEENVSIVSVVPFDLSENEDIQFLAGAWLHLMRYEVMQNGGYAMQGEYFVPVDTNSNIFYSKEFSLELEGSVSDSIVWKIGAVKAVEVEIKVIRS